MSLTLAAAAAAAGVNKTTLLRAIKAGKVSGNKDEHGQWHIEPAELQRVYPPVTQRADTDAPHYHATAALEAEIAPLRPRCHSPSLIYIHEFFCTIQCPPADLSLAQSCLAFSTVSKGPIWAR